jgi:type I restriction enzyme S subunit
VVIGRKGSLGTVFYEDGNYWPHDTTLWIKDFHGNHPKFAYYFLKTMGFERLDAGASNPSLNRNHIHTIPVRWPPLVVQLRVAGILSAYDELIANNQRRIEIVEAMVRSVYREWFVHFRIPGHSQAPRAASRDGNIPVGWEMKRLGDVAETFRGRSYRSVDLSDEGGLPFLNLKCLDRDGGFRRTGLKRYNGEFKDSHVVRRGDIVVAVTDMTQERRIVARAAMVPSLDTEFGVASMDLVRVEPRASIPKAFIYSFLRYSSFADEVKQYANGANVLHLAPERITDYRLAIPPGDLMRRYSGLVQPLYTQMDVRQNTIENLRRTRDLLLPRLVSGQIECTS